MSNFREIDLAGDARQRGISHGQQLRSEIAEALNFYRQIFMLSEADLRDRAEHFRGIISTFNPDYGAEIVGIADGSGQDELSIVALNARTEILALNGQVDANECTSMCFSGAPVLGQTWDWGQPLEAICAVLRITRPDGHVIRMLSEPGIIGKIGMNNAGLGVCLNILKLGRPLRGVPIHIMLRAILDSRSVAEATVMIDKAPLGKSSNIIVADSTGACFDREFAGEETLDPTPYNGNHVHTNHYMGKDLNAADDPLFFNSRARMQTAMERVTQASEHSVAGMIDILSDRSHAQFPIHRPYVPDDLLQSVGTVATIVMDLSARELHVRKGNHQETAFTTYSVS